MRCVIQRVKHAAVTVDGECAGKIDQGFLVLLGVGSSDSRDEADMLVKKLTSMRIFEDEVGKINLGIKDVGGNILLISQFTLYASCRHGNRPDFLASAPPTLANELYEYFSQKLAEHFPSLQRGIFGAYMQVELLNDGPFTIILDSDELKKRRSE